MNLYFYTRVAPHNGAVQKADRLHAQYQRCNQLRHDLGITRCHVYHFKDEGELYNPHELLPGLKRLLAALMQEETRALVMADFKGRLGKTSAMQSHVMSLIQQAGGIFLWIGFQKEQDYAETVKTILSDMRGQA